VTANIGSVAAGKQISRIDIGFDSPGASGSFQGYIDDVSLQPQSGLLSVPSTAAAGSAVTATATFTNTTGHTITGLKPTLQMPAGWPAATLTAQAPATLAPGQQATLTWKVTVPASASGGVPEPISPAGPGASPRRPPLPSVSPRWQRRSTTSASLMTPARRQRT
jgi:hypothetical protein